MVNLQNMNEWIWDTGKFMNRKYLMQDHYQKYLEGEEMILRLKKEDDPFWEPAEEIFIGLSNFFLQSLVYCIDFEDKAFISDCKVAFYFTQYKIYRQIFFKNDYFKQGQEIGTMKVNIAPCSASGKPLGEEAYSSDPNGLIGKPFNFKVAISSCEISQRENVKGFKMKFKLYGVDEFIETPLVPNSPEMKFNFNRIINYKLITKVIIKELCLGERKRAQKADLIIFSRIV
jgi:kinesin family protein 1